MEIVFASANRHKQEEIASIFPGHRILLPADLGQEQDHEETAETFLGNAMDKALVLRKKLMAAGRSYPVLADDSGLVVPALGGEPGVYSARYGSREGRLLGQEERNAYLLNRMQEVSDRRAYFVCAMVLLLREDERILAVQETLEGEILTEPRGRGGFGYDPLLYLPGLGKTVAELAPEEKDRLSHRGKAGLAIGRLLD